MFVEDYWRQGDSLDRNRVACSKADGGGTVYCSALVCLSFVCAPMQDSTKSVPRIRKGTRTQFRLQFGVKERREEYNEKRRGSCEEEKEGRTVQLHEDSPAIHWIGGIVKRVLLVICASHVSAKSLSVGADVRRSPTRELERA